MSEVYNDLHTLAPQHHQSQLYGTNTTSCVPFEYYPSLPYPVREVHYCYTSPPQHLNDFEIVIEQLGTDLEPRLNYGAKLRLLMADPIKGHDLRQALASLRIALKEAFRID